MSPTGKPWPLWAGIAALALGAPPAPAQPAPPAPRTVTYVVKPGDTVRGVSEALLDEPAQFLEVARFNRLRNPDLIHPGQRLEIPVELLRGSPAPLRLAAVNGDVRVNGAAAAAGSPVAEGAKLATGEGSSAVLVRSDGTRMQLLPGTLAEVKKNRVIEQQPGLLRSALALLSGAVDMVVEKLALKDHVKVTTPTSTIGVRGTQYRVGAQPSRSRVEVLQGTVAAASPAARSETAVAAGYGTVVPAGQPPLPAVALLPAPVLARDELLVRRAGAPLAFDAVSGAVAYRYLITPADRADAVVATGTAPASRIALPELPDGPYLVRVRAQDANGLEGFEASRRATYRIAHAPFDLTAAPLGRGLRLAWDVAKPSPRYRVQVARDAKFELIVAETMIGEREAWVRDLFPGRYYWRVGQERADPPGEWVYSEPARLEQP
jgi:hypothetical protein